MTLTVGSLFSGIGGFDLGFKRAGFEIAWQVEIDNYCKAVLKKNFPTVPCHHDIKTIDWQFVQPVDLVCGGFPCQPFSVAGKQRGTDDDRYLWPEVVRCLDALRPTWFLGENVPGLITMALDQVCADLESLGYAVWPVCLPACAVDAPHQRQRIWIMAHRNSRSQLEPDESRTIGRGEPRMDTRGSSARQPTGQSGYVADARHPRGEWRVRDWAGAQDQGRGNAPNQRRADREIVEVGTQVDSRLRTEWGRTSEPAVGLLADGLSARLVRWRDEPEGVPRVASSIPNRVHQLRGLGNAIVPQIAEEIGRMILHIDTKDGQ